MTYFKKRRADFARAFALDPCILLLPGQLLSDWTLVCRVFRLHFIWQNQLPFGYINALT